MTDEKTDSSHSIELPVGMLNALRQDGDLGGDDVNMGAGAMMDLDLNPIGLNLPNLKILEQPKSVRLKKKQFLKFYWDSLYIFTILFLK